MDTAQISGVAAGGLRIVGLTALPKPGQDEGRFLRGALVPDAFQQVYDPVAASVVASALVAAAPLAVIAVMLALLRVAPWLSAIAAALTAFVLAWLVWRMPLGLALAAVTQGMAFGVWPISWVVLWAVFFYNLSVASGDFDVIRQSLSRLTSDRRLQALLVAFGFGALIEGIAGFGAPVAITASMLAGLGFERITAAVLALVANTAPVAFGSIGIPVTTLGGLIAPLLGREAGDTTMALSAMVGRQLPFFSVIIPAYLVVLLAGWRRMIEVLPAVLAAGSSFAAAQFVVSNYVGPELTDTIASLCCIVALSLLLRVWRPREVYHGGGHGAPGGRRRRASRQWTAGSRLRHLRRARAGGAGRTGGQLRGPARPAAAAERDGAASLRAAGKPGVSGAVDRHPASRDVPGVSFSRLGLPVAGLVRGPERHGRCR